MNIDKAKLKDLPADGGEKYNRLVFEKSPYLLQHAENPVDWYPWGEEAFTKAKKEDKPVLLSIGYSTCHWCHVMAHEAFESERVAGVLNNNFVSIKVDREERPDLDNLYMKVAQVITGGGGWPLNVMMTPERKPFFAGTYFPVDSAYNRPGFIDILNSVIDIWRTDRGRLLDSAEKITGIITGKAERKIEGEIDKTFLDKAFQLFADSYDEQYGGFGEAPKFPSPHQLMFLLRYYRRTGEKKALVMVEKTLTALRMGGICDQLGGGFHRYSTDRQFLVPHFEKMLYDQAMLAIAYLETFQLTGDDFFGDAAREIFEYVLKDMTSNEGGFHSAEDADSEGGEGRFYLWSAKEVADLLGSDSAEKFNKLFGIKEEGNYYDEVSGTINGLNILHLTEKLWPPPMQEARQKLFRYREKRPRPFKDDKILTSWNGLMIGALALGWQIIGESSGLKAAEKAADFILSEMRDQEGRLLRRYRNGEAALPGYLDDYAFLVYGLLNLYEADFNEGYLFSAIDLTDEMIELFWDEEHEVFSFSGKGNEELFGSIHDFYDGAMPSGNSIGLLNLLKLSAITGKANYRRMAEKLARMIATEAGQYPSGYAMFLNGLDYLFGPSGEIVVAAELSEDTKKIIDLINSIFSPNKTVLLKKSGENEKKLAKIAPYIESQVMIDNKPTIYLCHNYLCEKPVVNLEELEQRLRKFL